MSVEERLDVLIKINKDQVNILEQLLRLWKKYDAQYLEEVEGDNIVSSEIIDNERINRARIDRI
tara:strand:- start:2434 stop:2625 length:192 start_codon:yes stop_codon:yes gene_type:complete